MTVFLFLFSKRRSFELVPVSFLYRFILALYISKWNFPQICDTNGYIPCFSINQSKLRDLFSFNHLKKMLLKNSISENSFGILKRFFKMLWFEVLLCRLLRCNLDFLGGSVVQNLPANAGDTDLIPGSGRSSGGGNGNPNPVFLPGESHGQRSLTSYNQ